MHVKDSSFAKNLYCYFSMSWWGRGRDWTKLIKPHGLLCLFLDFPLTFPWADQMGRWWCYNTWLMCVFGRHTRPCQVLIDLKLSWSSFGPLGSGIWGFNRGIVWTRDSPPALWQHSINFNLELHVCESNCKGCQHISGAASHYIQMCVMMSFATGTEEISFKLETLPTLKSFQLSNLRRDMSSYFTDRNCNVDVFTSKYLVPIPTHRNPALLHPLLNPITSW